MVDHRSPVVSRRRPRSVREKSITTLEHGSQTMTVSRRGK
ncbi:hypothetical protein NJ7G_1223 [Natrinema sp. J7-2]|nr:hypothetical protein NJ7G_1223 [Natrinema sp. J7-2]